MLQIIGLKLHKKRTIKVIVMLLIGLVVVSLIYYKGFGLNVKEYSSTDVAMGTFVAQTVYSNNSESTSKEAFKKIKELENKISWRIDLSDVSKINSAKTYQWIDVDKATMESLLPALKVAEKTNGAFDAAILPISILWDFNSEKKMVPSQENINKAITLTGYNKIEVDENLCRVRKTTDSFIIDLGGVGKGSACDAALDVYKCLKVKAAVVSVGGSVGIFGKKSDKTPFQVAIRDPFDTENSSSGFAVLSLQNGCVSTSGAYEKNFTVDNKFYHHILNTKTGYPTDSELASVTVCHEKGAVTDILATACYVLGKDKSLDLLKEYKAEAVFVDQNKNVFVTNGLKDKLLITRENYVLRDW